MIYHLRLLEPREQKIATAIVLESYSWNRALKVLHLANNSFATLKGLPPGIEALHLMTCTITSFVGLPASLKYLNICDSQVTSLEGLPAGLERLCLRYTRIYSLPTLPIRLINLDLGDNITATFDLAPVFAATNCGELSIFYAVATRTESYQALQRASCVPLNERPARVVLVVLSSSSVPRVGTRSAVRRLNRSDLVREMAGMLNEGRTHLRR